MVFRVLGLVGKFICVRSVLLVCCLWFVEFG